MVYRWCIVPLCKNTSIKTPQKIFINVPRGGNGRQLWITSVKRDPNEFSSSSVLYVCEDHFNLRDDMENYMKWKLIGEKKRMKKNVVPHKFDCQEEPIVVTSPIPKPLINKKSRSQVPNDKHLNTNSPIEIPEEIVVTPEISSYRSIGTQVQVPTFTNKAIQCVLKKSSKRDNSSELKQNKESVTISLVRSKKKKYLNPFYSKRGKLK